MDYVDPLHAPRDRSPGCTRRSRRAPLMRANPAGEPRGRWSVGRHDLAATRALALQPPLRRGCQPLLTPLLQYLGTLAIKPVSHKVSSDCVAVGARGAVL